MQDSTRYDAIRAHRFNQWREAQRRKREARHALIWLLISLALTLAVLVTYLPLHP